MIIDWLLAGDPSVRWQVMRDLLGMPEERVAVERARVATEGWGAELLTVQDPDGRWAGALYSPKWTSTTYTLLLLERLGLGRGDARALAGCRQLWDGAHWYGDGLTLANHREPTVMVAGRQFFLEHHLYRSHRNGEMVDRAFGQFPFPPQWHFDVTRSGALPCRRGRPLRAPRRGHRGGPWGETNRRYVADAPALRGWYWFVLEERGASRWSTLRAMRAPAWWDDPRLR